jgi:hypothetical protein
MRVIIFNLDKVLNTKENSKVNNLSILSNELSETDNKNFKLKFTNVQNLNALKNIRVNQD